MNKLVQKLMPSLDMYILSDSAWTFITITTFHLKMFFFKFVYASDQFESKEKHILKDMVADIKLETF